MTACRVGHPRPIRLIVPRKLVGNGRPYELNKGAPDMLAVLLGPTEVLVVVVITAVVIFLIARRKK